MTEYLPYILVMAVVTYLIRMLPLTFFQKEIKSPFIKSFLFYVPYAVLGAMKIGRASCREECRSRWSPYH